MPARGNTGNPFSGIKNNFPADVWRRFGKRGEEKYLQFTINKALVGIQG